jgi:hypothetical protein
MGEAKFPSFSRHELGFQRKSIFLNVTYLFIFPIQVDEREPIVVDLSLMAMEKLDQGDFLTPS